MSSVASWAWAGILALLHTSCVLGVSLCTQSLRVLMCELDIVPEFLLHMEDLISLCLQGSVYVYVISYLYMLNLKISSFPSQTFPSNLNFL